MAILGGIGDGMQMQIGGDGQEWDTLLHSRQSTSTFVNAFLAPAIAVGDSIHTFNQS